MKRKIELSKRNIEYTLKISARAQRLRLVIYPDGNVVVTAPRRMSEKFIEQFIIKKSQWVIDKLEYFTRFGGKVFLKSGKRNFARHKDLALALVSERIEYFNGMYGFKVTKISIKNQKTRWGSCSKKGNLNFNYKIALLPPHLADYIIVHELCHLGQMNHSATFWDLVAEMVPNYRERRRELNKSGIKL